MSEDTPVYDTNTAKAALEADQKARGERCTAKIRKALEEEQCDLELSIVKVPLGNGAWGDVPQAHIAAK